VNAGVSQKTDFGLVSQIHIYVLVRDTALIRWAGDVTWIDLSRGIIAPTMSTAPGTSLGTYEFPPPLQAPGIATLSFTW
jgi:hypothetical protein